MAKANETLIESTFDFYPFSVVVSGKAVELTTIPDGQAEATKNTMNATAARRIASALTKAANQLEPKPVKKKRGGVRTETT